MSSSPDSEPPEPAPASKLDDAASATVIKWLEQYGDRLYRYARGRVSNESIAEDLVQETLMAALKNFTQFQGKSTPYTWLTAILRRKLIDHYRRQVRRREIQQLPESSDAEFDKRGIWTHSLGNWPRRDFSELEQAEFREVLDECLQKLPPPLAEAFVLRVFDELETENICKILNISASNLAVRLHRARLGMRTCLEKSWFEK